jgi:hypothetical protein
MTRRTPTLRAPEFQAVKRSWLLGLALLAVGTTACTGTEHVTAKTTTTTTVPPTTTTTVPLVTVPNAVATAHAVGSGPARQDLVQAGLVPVVNITTTSSVCYFQDPLNGQMEWNYGAIISQAPAPGALAPRGSTVTLYTCVSSLEH